MRWRPDNILRPQYETDPTIQRTVWDGLSTQAARNMIGWPGLAARNLGTVESPFLNLKQRRVKLELDPDEIRPAHGTLRLG